MREQRDLSSLSCCQVESSCWGDGEDGDADAAVVGFQGDGEEGPARRCLELDRNGV